MVIPFQNKNCNIGKSPDNHKSTCSKDVPSILCKWKNWLNTNPAGPVQMEDPLGGLSKGRSGRSPKKGRPRRGRQGELPRVPKERNHEKGKLRIHLCTFPKYGLPYGVVTFGLKIDKISTTPKVTHPNYSQWYSYDFPSTPPPKIPRLPPQKLPIQNIPIGIPMISHQTQ